MKLKSSAKKLGVAQRQALLWLAAGSRWVSDLGHHTTARLVKRGLVSLRRLPRMAAVLTNEGKLALADVRARQAGKRTTDGR